MKKSFTLIELLVTVSIIILLAAAGGMAFKTQQDRANLDTAVTKLKDAILETQNYAFAPERGDVDGYVFVLNTGSNQQTYGNDVPPVTLNPNSYGIFAMVFAMVEENRYKVKVNQVLSVVTVSSTAGLGYVDTNNLFKIYFRVKDGVAGCSEIYYDNSQWGDLCALGGDYAEINVTLTNRSKTIKIHKITGQIEIE